MIPNTSHIFRARLQICRSSPRASRRVQRHYSAATEGTSRTSVITEDEIQRARTYCSNLIRNYDSPSFTLQTFIPPASRDAYLAIRAFNIDVARVADATSSATVGTMRMQFWRDTITKSLAGTPPKEPVAVLLAHAAEDLQYRTNGRSRMSKNWFHRIIETRAEHLHNPPMLDLAALETYAENTYSTLLYLTLQTLPVSSLTADHLASHIGKATGIATLLRGLPLIAFPPPPNKHNPTALNSSLPATRQGAVLLPLDIMASAGVIEEQVFREGAAAAGLRDAVFEVATRANDHLITAREMLKNLRGGKDVGHDYEHTGDAERADYTPQNNTGTEKQMEEVDAGFGVLMQAITTQTWLDRLQKVDFDVFDPSLRRTDWKLPWRAYWAYKRRQL